MPLEFTVARPGVANGAALVFGSPTTCKTGSRGSQSYQSGTPKDVRALPKREVQGHLPKGRFEDRQHLVVEGVNEQLDHPPNMNRSRFA